jgi:hypothetical protein
MFAPVGHGRFDHRARRAQVLAQGLGLAGIRLEGEQPGKPLVQQRLVGGVSPRKVAPISAMVMATGASSVSITVRP